MIEYRKRGYLSVSTLLDFARCQRRYFYRKCGLARPDDEGNGALLYGTAMHKAVPIAATKGHTAAVSAFLSVWDEKLNDVKRNPERALYALKNYIETHAGRRSLYTFESPPKNELPVDQLTSEFEIPWAIDIGLPIPLVGRIDGVVRHRDTGDLWGWEFKTTSRLTTAFLEGFHMNTQLMVYAMVLRMMFNEPVRGIMLEGMLVDKAKTETMILPILVSDHHVSDILTWLQMKGKQLLEAEERMTFLKEFTGCSPYSMFGMSGWRCEYADLCAVENWEDMSALYTVQEEHRFGEAPTKVVSLRTLPDIPPNASATPEHALDCA